MAPVFRGAYPLSCGEQLWHLSLLDRGRYFAAAFGALWKRRWRHVERQDCREGTVPADARRIALHESAPLAEVIRDVNKFSNNVMARQIYLTVGTDGGRQAASAARGRGSHTRLARQPRPGDARTGAGERRRTGRAPSASRPAAWRGCCATLRRTADARG